LEIDRDAEPSFPQAFSQRRETARQPARSERQLAKLTAREHNELIDLGVADQEIARRILHHPGQVQARIGPAEQVKGRQRAQHVTHGSETDEEHAIVILEVGDGTVHQRLHLTLAPR